MKTDTRYARKSLNEVRGIICSQIAEDGCCCCSHINSHNQVRGHRTGSSHSGAGEYPREKHKQPKVVHTYITADATQDGIETWSKKESAVISAA